MSDDKDVKLGSLKADLKKESRKLGLNFDDLKSGGFIKQTQKDLFTVRLRCPGGKVTVDRLRKAADVAEKYGEGWVHLSVRQSIEVPFVSYKDFDDVNASVRELDWSVASCGPRVRVPTACAGCTYNPNAITDAQAMCFKVDEKYFGMPTGHHKFKISFSACPIDCFRTREMDLGFQGIMEPGHDQDLCTSCGLCVKGCEEHALKMIDDIPVRDLTLCIQCGDCVKVCPVDAMVSHRTGWMARVGGKHGKHPIFAYEVARFLGEEQVYTLIEKTIEWYRENGEGRERIGSTIDRVGLDKYMDEVIKPLDLEIVDSPEDRAKYYAIGNFYEGHKRS